MNEIMAIAGGTWRRIPRMRVVYFLILCVLILIGSAYNYDILSMGMHKQLMVDVSLVLNAVAAILIAVSITSLSFLSGGLFSVFLPHPWQVSYSAAGISNNPK